MNLYDTKQISCSRCEKPVGEVDYDAKIINPLCGDCADLRPTGDSILYLISTIQSQAKKRKS